MFGNHRHGGEGRHHHHAMRGGWGGRGFGPDRGWDGGGGRGRRIFDGDALRLVLLALIAEQPRHGYDLIREIEARSGGGYAPSPGVIYPALALLDEMGLLEELAEPGARKRFALSDAGRVHLAERREAVDALLARLAELAGHGGGRDGLAVRRALANLHMAVRGALDGDAGRARAVVDVLDEAVRLIERGDAA